MRRTGKGLSTDTSIITPLIRTPLILQAKGYCLVCGRKLKSEQSKALGYGKICAKKLTHRGRGLDI